MYYSWPGPYPEPTGSLSSPVWLQPIRLIGVLEVDSKLWRIYKTGFSGSFSNIWYGKDYAERLKEIGMPF